LAKKQNKLKVMFLGGVGEIGKNMTLFEYGNHILVVDAGMSFPSDQMPGIDFVIPDYNYLIQNESKVAAIVVTHGHEDHIGALPFVLRDLDVPVYGSKLALAMVTHKLGEAKVKNKKLNAVNEGDIINAGCFQVEFVRVNHSTTGAFALSITTPKGVVFYTGDFKIDHTPIDNKPIDLTRIAEIGKNGVMLLMMDSTNAERNGYSMSERCVYKNMDNLFAQNIDKRIIVATFASNVHRVQQIINCAIKYNRKIAFSGRSMINIAEMAYTIGELKYPRESIVDIDKIGKIPYDKLCIISTGTQGEPSSALTRMSQNDFKRVVINEKDTVILSASAIPGNEKLIYNVINNLYRMGADVIYQSLSEIHVSGHACKEELKMMFTLIKPSFFIPIHGEYRHLKQNISIAKEMGIPEDNCIIPETGYAVEVGKKGIVRTDNIPAGSILVDGSVVSDDSEMLLRDRRHLAGDGFVIAIVSKNSLEINPPIIISRGVSIPDKMSEELREAIIKELNKDKTDDDIQGIKHLLRKLIAKSIVKELKKKPMVIPIILEN
jgi:ribonuclease J